MKEKSKYAIAGAILLIGGFDVMAGCNDGGQTASNKVPNCNANQENSNETNGDNGDLTNGTPSAGDKNIDKRNTKEKEKFLKEIQLKKRVNGEKNKAKINKGASFDER